MTEPVGPSDLPRRCPTPEKRIRVATEYDARLADFKLKLRLGADYVRMKPYPCPCGLWHLRDVKKWNRNHKLRKKANRRLRKAQEGT